MLRLSAGYFALWPTFRSVLHGYCGGLGPVPAKVTSAGVVYRRPLGDLVLRLCGEFGGQGGVVCF